MYNREFIITISDLDIYTTSKLKGMALEALIDWTSNKRSTLPPEKEKEIMTAILTCSKKLFYVYYKFKLVLNDTKIKEFDGMPDFNKKIIFDEDSIRDFNKIDLSFKENGGIIQLTFNGCSKLTSYLLNKGLISRIDTKAIYRRFRLDFWWFKNEKFCFREIKNREKTYLSKRDVEQVIRYAMILKEFLPLGYILLVHNGYISQRIREKIEAINENSGLDIRPMDIKNWLTNFAIDSGRKIDYLVFSYHPLSKHNLTIHRVSYDSTYFLNVHVSEYDKNKDYKPIKLLITNDIEKIEKFIAENIPAHTYEN
ncbi:hypothetical protein KY347_04065 [Candidatus Woesearchaeota archaeon]|nr:hypothetical protein [Candidatus Woesearchaeota archaeon]